MGDARQAPPTVVRAPRIVGCRIAAMRTCAARWRIEAGRPPTGGCARRRPAAPSHAAVVPGRQRPSERADVCPFRKSGEAIPRADFGPRDPWPSNEPRWCMPRQEHPRPQLLVGAGAPAARARIASLRAPQRERVGAGPREDAKSGRARAKADFPAREAAAAGRYDCCAQQSRL